MCSSDPVQNALCSCHATHVAAGVEIRSLHLEGALVGASVSSALLSVEPCGKEILEMAHVHLRTAQAALATTKAHTRLRNITVEYLEAIHEIQLLTAPSFEAQTVQVSCPACAQGVTFASASTGLQAVSPPSLHCEDTALLNGTTARCGCAFPQQVPDDVHYGLDVEVSETGSYCMYCPSHSQARGEECEKCPLHKAWSEGTGDPCAALPVQAELWLPLLLAAAVFVLLAAAAFEVLWAPLAVVDAHTEGEGLLVTVQGPVCHLPKFFLNHIRKEVAYSFQGTGLSWLDSQKLISGKVKSLRRCKLQLPLQPEQPPYACATSKGFLRVTRGYTRMLLQFWILLFLLLLVPTVLVVARLSKNGPWHVLVTEGYFVLPLGVCAALLHFAAPRGGLASAQAADTAAPGVPQRAQLLQPSTFSCCRRPGPPPEPRTVHAGFAALLGALQALRSREKHALCRGQHRGAAYREAADLFRKPPPGQARVLLRLAQLGHPLSALCPVPAAPHRLHGRLRRRLLDLLLCQ